MADVKFEHSSAGYVSLMKSGETKDVLYGYANDIVHAANDAIHEDRFAPPLERSPYYAFDFYTRDRVGVRVQTNNPHARLAEAQYGPLQNAVGV